ncbi:hypothetical protein [Luteibacter yeojuensis]|uniref:Uncharacterized protein n=1 Tax=Luteibacter yeojuensis TaxID=345309 RepID=A0A0F3KK17_9GAMM|nr:hypothetical protein [Luteibacter yeojuensis]KJV31332.1 hypothetical protein VI08_13910 [Luteibacter yeojuensis]
MTQRERRFSIRRTAAIATATAIHAALLIALLRPAPYRIDIVRLARESSSTLALRFVARARPITVHPYLPAKAPHATTTIARSLRTRQPAATSAAPPTVSSLAPASPSAPVPMPMLMPMRTETAPPLGDGGFQQRLQAAQHAGDVRGVPGSGRQRAPGLALVDPRTQGVAGAVRTLQRLFGVKEKACVDVDRLGTLTIDELVARHVTPTELKTMVEKYGCNEPPGLHF